MRRVRDNWFAGFRVKPTAENTTAWKDERVCAVIIDNRQFQIAIKRRGRYGLPLHGDRLLLKTADPRGPSAGWHANDNHGKHQAGRAVHYVESRSLAGDKPACNKSGADQRASDKPGKHKRN